MLQPGADPVRKVSIVPRGRALGVTFQSADADRYAYEEPYLRGRIIGALGGRAAEQLVYGHVTTGAESDLEQVTAIARQMVGRWGMSDAVGPITVLPGPGAPLLPTADGPSPATLQLVDGEVRRIVDDCYAAARDLLRANRERLDNLAHTLLDTRPSTRPTPTGRRGSRPRPHRYGTLTRRRSIADGPLPTLPRGDRVGGDR
jgi:cell division protease FtsH